MGNAIALNSVDLATNAMVSIMNQSIQECVVAGQQEQDINIFGYEHVTLNNIAINALGQVNITCLQHGFRVNQVQQDLDAVVQQTAEAINQNLNLFPGTTESENIVGLVNNLSDTIKNTYIQTCGSRTQQEQQFNFSGPGTPGSSANLSGISNQLILQSVINCTQQDRSVNEAKQRIKIAITQHAVAEVQGLFGPLLLIIAIGVIIFFFGRQGFSIRTIMIIVIIVVLYFVIAIWLGLPPFQR